MAEHIRYQHPKLEICRNCQGEGIVYQFDKLDILQQNPLAPYECTTCLGHGRVFVSKKTVINITPFKTKQ